MYRSASHCDWYSVHACCLELHLISHGTEPQVNWLNVRRTRSCLAWGSSLLGWFKVFSYCSVTICIHLLELPEWNTQTGGLHKRDFLPHGSGGRKSTIKVLAGLVSPEASPWLADGCRPPVSLCGLFSVHPGVPLCVQISFYKNTHQTGSGTIHMAHLTLITFLKLYLQIQSPPEIPGVISLTYVFGEDAIQSIVPYISIPVMDTKSES